MKKIILSFILLGTVACSPVRSPSTVSSGQPRAVFLDSNGNDNRTDLRSDKFPWSAIGKVVAADGECTGTLVGRSTMVTAAHCVLVNGQISHITFMVNYVNGHYAGKSTSRTITVGTKYPDRDREEDWAVVELNNYLGDDQGYMGWNSSFPNFPFELKYAGYSDDYYGGRIAGVDTDCFIRTRFRNGAIGHDCSATPGGSGGPLFRWDEDGRVRLYAIHTRGIPDGVYRSWSNQNSNTGVDSDEFFNTIRYYRNYRDN